MGRIVHYPKKTDPHSSLHKREVSQTKKCMRFLIETTIASSSKSSKKKTNFVIGWTTKHHCRLLFVLQVAACPDDPMTLRIQETTDTTSIAIPWERPATIIPEKCLHDTCFFLFLKAKLILRSLYFYVFPHFVLVLLF